MPRLNVFSNSLLNATFTEGGLALNASKGNSILVYTAFWTFCCIALHSFWSTSNHKTTGAVRQRGGVPPPVPLSMAFLASLPFRMTWDPVHLLSSYPIFTKLAHPICLRLFNKNIYINQGPENVASLLDDKNLTPILFHSTLLRNVFGAPRAAWQVYDHDNSGSFPKPRPGTNIEPRNRVGFLSRSTFHRFLTGPGLTPLCKSFEEKVQEKFRALPIGPEWHAVENFVEVCENSVAAAVVDVLYGPALLQQEPGLLEDFRIFDRNVRLFLCRVPVFLARKAYRARRNLISAVKRWRSWARAHFEETAINADKTDPYWGSEFNRDRQAIYDNMDGHNTEARAITDLAFLWAVIPNTTMSIFWCAFGIYRNPELLHDIRKEAAVCITFRSPDAVHFDTDALMHQPLLQAVFAETLRLRVHGFVPRYPQKDLRVNEWIFPKDNIVLTCVTTAHMDEQFWSSADRGGRPASEFFPGRFLSNKGDGGSSFTMENTKGAWMAFGGGVHACPGRQFAKRQALHTLALLVTLYDVEILTHGKVEMSASKFGFGVLGPSRRIAAKMRLRDTHN